MKVINPLNRIPETEETMVMGGCHCVCYSGQSSTYTSSWLPLMPSCECSCDGNDNNSNANYDIAYNAGH
jgi:hypothetical protein